MKKLFCFVVISTILLLSFCACDVDPYRGKRPRDYAGSKWECSEYQIVFTISDENTLEDGTIFINGENIPFTFLWSVLDSRVNMTFEVDGEEVTISGNCKFGAKKFSIMIDDTKGYYPEEQVTFNFERVS